MKWGRRSWAGLAAGALLIGCTGCARFSETYYFRAQDPEADSSLYYRVKIRGGSTWSKSRYSAGFFDAKAVDDLFGEVAIAADLEERQRDLEVEQSRREALGQFRSAAREANAVREAAAEQYAAAVKEEPQDQKKITEARAVLVKAVEEWEQAQSRLRAEETRYQFPNESALDPAGNVIDVRGKRFVLFMNSNTDALALALSKLNEQNEVVDSLVAIATADENLELESTKLKNDQLLSVSRVIVKDRDALIGAVEGIQAGNSLFGTTLPGVTDVRTELLATFNRIARFYGSSGQMDIDQAEAWLAEHASDILGQTVEAQR